MRKMQRLIFLVWHKLNRIICLDPKCVQRIFRLKFERTVSRYYSQMVVEFRTDQADEQYMELDQRDTTNSNMEI